MLVAYKHSGTYNRFFCLLSHSADSVDSARCDLGCDLAVTSLLMANKNRSLKRTRVLVKALQESQRREQWRGERSCVRECLITGCSDVGNWGKLIARGCTRTSAWLGIEHAANLGKIENFSSFLSLTYNRNRAREQKLSEGKIDKLTTNGSFEKLILPSVYNHSSMASEKGDEHLDWLYRRSFCVNFDDDVALKRTVYESGSFSHSHMPLISLWKFYGSLLPSGRLNAGENSWKALLANGTTTSRRSKR